MEVHHHATREHKKLKEYLSEGLMIFFAVFLGFLAENFREHINAGEKEHEYIIGLIHNLEQDKFDINSTISENRLKLRLLDSMLALATGGLSDPHDKKAIYQYATMVSFYSSFSSNDATMTQLKNAGGLQFIKKEHIADSIARYDEVIRSINAAEVPYAKAINDAVDAMSEILVFNIWKDSTYFKSGVATEKAPPLLSNDPQQITRFFNKLSMERGWTQNYLENLQDKLPFTLRLIELLRKEYDIN